MTDCIGILYSDSEIMDLTGFLILAPLYNYADRGDEEEPADEVSPSLQFPRENMQEFDSS
eukprot:COSAG02_NODE_8591_length_2511_cov_9.911277_3_plen_60_part_00